MSDEVSRRDFLKLFGIGAAMVAAGAAGIKPLPVDMSKQGEGQIVEPAVQEVASRTEWVHPCEDKVELDEECKDCNYYFCPPGYRARMWIRLREGTEP